MKDFDKVDDLTEYLFKNYKKYYGFVYITKNNVSNRYYIGQKKIDSSSKWKSYLGSGIRLVRALNKYGKENFTRKIVALANDEEELDNLEYQYISNYNAVDDDDFYNLIEGGNVRKAIIKSNSNPVICVNNGYVFKSISDASIWSELSPTEIKKSYRKTLPLFYVEPPLVFRPLSYVKINHRLCKSCANNFIPIRHNDELCKTCTDDKFGLRQGKKLNFKNDNSICYSLDEDWVFDYLIRIKDKEEKSLKLNTFSTNDLKKINDNRSLIIQKYNYGVSINQIAIELDIKNQNHIKNSLVNWKVQLKPKCFSSYSNPSVKPRYLRVTDNEVLYFKYLFELKYWMEKYKTSKIGKSYIEQKIKTKNKEYGFIIEEIDEKTFIENIDFYKRVDNL